MQQIQITKATLTDLPLIQSIGRETFFETFAEHNSEADMQKYLAESFSEEKLSAELSNPASQFYIAKDGDTVIGYMKLNTGAAQTELQDDTAIEIERIYVKSAYYGKQVGQLLYEKALAVAQEENKAYIWLAVWEENPRAMKFYEKNGFVKFGEHIFRLGDEDQTDIMMKKEL